MEENLLYKFVEEDEVQFHLVRTVAPSKHMWCISFRLPKVIGFA
jgi:tRNA (guanine37-N1)-methyltransferase